jgi:alpha-tubulin suppressor-like RCC1 family protein
MSASVVSTCASRAGRVLCWGRLWDRVALVPTEIPELRGAASVQLSSGATCARFVDGHIACAGNPRSGILGTFEIDRSDALTPIEGIDDATDLAVGTSFACAVRSDASVWCWGDDSVGQTGQPIPDHGTGAYAPQLVPLPVAGPSDVLAIEAGSSFACALRASGEVVCWGSDAWGALGRGAGYSGRPEPAFAPIEGIDDAIGLTAQGNGGCVIRADGTTWCWGGAVYHYPGFDRATEDHCSVVVEQSCWRAPRPITIEPATVIVLGGERGCARGAIQWTCFGRDDERSLPEPEAPIAASEDVVLGARHTCARAGDRVRCRGRGEQGQLGDGLATSTTAWVDASLD